MLSHLLALVCALGFVFAAGSDVAFAATPAAEKAFVDAYKKAIETSDKKALLGFLHTEGAHPMALDFYKEMVVESAGAVIEEIGLRELTAEDKQKIGNSPGPDGKPMKTNIPIVKKLTMKLEKKYPGGTSTSTSSVFIGEVGGKLVIAVPEK